MMAVNERDLRMVVVAFEDAVTWCETLADAMDGLIAAAKTRQPIDDRTLAAAVAQVAETRRLLAADQSEVRRIRERAGIV
jgi:hypothetical protein